jgi:hypothetical protein
MWCNAWLHFYPQIPQKEVMATTTLLNSTCVAVPVLTAPTSGYGVFLCIPKEGAKNATLQCMDWINFIYQVIWLMWILKLSEGNSNNKWKRVDHDATFTCLLQLSSHKVKHGLKEHHLTISNSQHQNNHTHETINKYNDPTLPPDDRQNSPRPPTAVALLLLIL